MTQIPDVDMDVKDPSRVMTLFPTGIRASIAQDGVMVEHNSGLYLQRIPFNPLTELAAFPYDIAEDLGYYKIDLLSNSVYDGVRSMAHLQQLLASPINWAWFTNAEFVATLFHFKKTADIVATYAPGSIQDLACLIAIKLPGKKHLIGQPWGVVRAEIWKKEDRGAQFKKSHAIPYAMAVGVDAGIKAPAFFPSVE